LSIAGDDHMSILAHGKNGGATPTCRVVLPCGMHPMQFPVRLYATPFRYFYPFTLLLSRPKTHVHAKLFPFFVLEESGVHSDSRPRSWISPRSSNLALAFGILQKARTNSSVSVRSI